VRTAHMSEHISAHNYSYAIQHTEFCLEKPSSNERTTVCRWYTGWPKNWHNIFVRLNVIKYEPILEIISLSESGENLQ